MKKQFAALTLFAASVVGVMLFHAPSSGTPAFNLAYYPYAEMSLLHPTNLKASACVDNGQEALKRSGFTRTGSNHPGTSFFGVQGQCLAGISWDSDRYVYYYVIAGPDRATVLDYEKTLLQNAQALLKS